MIPRTSPQAFRVTASKEYGASAAILGLAKELELDRMIYTRAEPWVEGVLAMVVGRLGYAGSDLSLSQLWPRAALWELCGLDGPIDVERHCHEPMDRLEARQEAIQKALARRHLSSGQAVLYDVTGAYFEGDLARSRRVGLERSGDDQRGHEPGMLGLVCSLAGCPVAVEFFATDPPEARRVLERAEGLRRDCGIKELIFVGDRGVITRATHEKLKRPEGMEGLASISALTHPEVARLLERKVITPELFDERRIVEVTDPEQASTRYCLCRDPRTGARELATRQALLEGAGKELRAIAGTKRRANPDRLGALVGKLLAQ